MDTVKLGSTGLDVSPICLGCMSYGEPERGPHPWSLDEAASRPFFEQALDAGINFFDTANAYSDGSSEEITGRWLGGLADRDQIVLATKVYMRMHDGPNGQGLSRKAILTQIDRSLTRLGMDYVDLYQIHRLDRTVPIEETMEALHDVVKSGKARYIGASSMWAWEFARCQEVARANGWTAFATMQDQLSLIHREEQREMLPLCEAEGVGVIPWSPLARGRLTRPWGETTSRSDSDEAGKTLFGETDEGIVASDRAVVEAVGEVAEARGVSRAQIALAWVSAQPAVSAPIVGATKAHHLEDAVASLDIELTDDEIEKLEAPYVPHRPQGF